MTPYELRFEIFKQANGLAQDEYHAAFTVAEQWNQLNSVKMDYPDFLLMNRLNHLQIRLMNL
jgi:hypothetical protein